MRVVRRSIHLARRWWRSLPSTEPSTDDVEWVESILAPGERELWGTMAVADRRHSIEVARRFVRLLPQASRAATAAALLHDVGKSVASLSTTGRVVATVVGARGRRFRDYHRHEEIGLELCRRAGSCDETLAVLAGRGPDEVVAALRGADDI